jgi:hypothetical protein
MGGWGCCGGGSIGFSDTLCVKLKVEYIKAMAGKLLNEIEDYPALSSKSSNSNQILQ